MFRRSNIAQEMAKPKYQVHTEVY